MMTEFWKVLGINLYQTPSAINYINESDLYQR